MTSELLICFAAACAFAEFVGYWLHILLHSDKIGWLSRAHMIHHLRIYAPDKPQRQSSEYLKSTYGRASVLGLGLEWLAPVFLILAFVVPTLELLGVSAAGRVVFVGTSLGWGALMFWYMHDAMHLRGFWMEASPLWSAWFLRARRRHDIHHMDLDDDGLIRRNFGICFFAFDRLFGTFSDAHRRFNRLGLENALRRYAKVLA